MGIINDVNDMAEEFYNEIKNELNAEDLMFNKSFATFISQKANSMFDTIKQKGYPEFCHDGDIWDMLDKAASMAAEQWYNDNDVD